MILALFRNEEAAGGEGPTGAPSGGSTYTYGGGDIGVQWTNGDATSQTQVAQTGGADPTAGDVVATVGPGITQYETDQTQTIFWWVRHAKNGQFSAWEECFVAGALTPDVTNLVQITPPSSCSAACSGCVEVRLTLDADGPGNVVVQEKVGAGSFSDISTVAATQTTFNRSGRDPGVTYQYRIRYEDISPAVYGTSQSLSTECTLL